MQGYCSGMWGSSEHMFERATSTIPPSSYINSQYPIAISCFRGFSPLYKARSVINDALCSLAYVSCNLASTSASQTLHDSAAAFLITIYTQPCGGGRLFDENNCASYLP